MTDVPAIFSAPMVRAWLDGRKGMTRRLAWHPSKREIGVLTDPKDREAKPTPWQKVKLGDRLWVRENWRPVGLLSECTGPSDVRFAATVGEAEWATSKWRPSIHMPRWASRLTLIVSAVKIERLQAITDADCLAEGATLFYRASMLDGGPMVETDRPGTIATPRCWFRTLWDSLHGPGAWDANPEVVAISATAIKANIDTLGKVAA